MTNEILLHLSLDPKMKKVVETTTLPVYDTARSDLYYNLIRAIVGQQLSGKAASTIFGRFINLFADAYPHPDEVLALDMPTLRSVGLSRQKASYIVNVAEFFEKEQLHDKDWSDMDDNAIIKYLTTIKGVGKWTVQMILMFTLNRPDVLPLDDLGIQQGMMLLYDFEAKGRELKKKMTEIAETWRPYRSWACRYVWAWKDGQR